MMYLRSTKKLSGFALLNVMLGTLLLAGIVYLVMHAMSNFHSEQNSRSIGEQLAPLLAELLLEDVTAMSGNYPLVSDATFCTGQGGLLTDIPSGYLQSLASSGFDLCNGATVNIAMS